VQQFKFDMFKLNNLLLYILLFPIFGILTLLLIPAKEEKMLKLTALNFSIFSFIGSLILWGFFQKSIGAFQFVVKFFWLPALNLNFTLGIDGISIFFLLLTTLLIPLCIFTSWNSVNKNIKEFLIAFLVLDFFLIGTFCVLDLLLFYIFFESVLIPMFLIVGVWGSRDRKILAAYYFFLYTLLGSVLMLLSILYIYYHVGTTDYEVLLTFFFHKLSKNFYGLLFF
jgi:NADH-quinone oxidoreductase subunit M